MEGEREGEAGPDSELEGTQQSLGVCGVFPPGRL